MTHFLSKEVLEGLELARKRSIRKKNRLRVRFDDEAFTIVRMSENGFELKRENTDHLRGLVDIYEGSRHLYQALIVATEDEGELRHFDFKRMTPASDRPALDYIRKTDAPVALLPRN